jgi:signal transduction histidine kinase
VNKKFFSILIGMTIIPLLLLGAGFYFTFIQSLPWFPKISAGSSNVAPTIHLKSLIAPVESEQKNIASDLLHSITSTYQKMQKWTHQPETDSGIQKFLVDHPELAGAFLVNQQGVFLKMFPSNAGLIPPNYAATHEFKIIRQKFSNPAFHPPYQFFTQRLPYSALIFTTVVKPKWILGVVLNLNTFFATATLNGGNIGLLEPNLGKYFYDSNVSLIPTAFNPQQRPWLSKIQQDLEKGKSGFSINPDRQKVDVFTPLGLGAFGIVQSIAMPSTTSMGGMKHPLSIQALEESPLSASLILIVLWILIIGSLENRSLKKPWHQIEDYLTKSAKNSNPLPGNALSRKDEVGQVLQIVASWTDRLNKEKEATGLELETIKKNAKTQLDQLMEETKQFQHQAEELEEDLKQKNQQLEDKLTELAALKNMTEGLRSQTEQVRTENSKMKMQITNLQEKEKDFQNKLIQAEAKSKEAEEKLLKIISTTSSTQVSKVRVDAIKAMSEELKTTLGIIKGYVSSALSSAQGGISEKQQEFLGMVINRSARLEKFINDILDIYMVEIEKETAVKEDIVLSNEIEALIFNFQSQSEIKNLKFKLESKLDLPPISVVRKRFVQLWNIILLQIIKDAPRGSVIPIHLESVGESIKVTIQDPGLTIAPDNLSNVFNEFYDVKHSGSPQLAGTGLKLALVKTILVTYGGWITAESADPGTRLSLAFSAKMKSTTPKTAGGSASSGGEKAATLKSASLDALGSFNFTGKPPISGLPREESKSTATVELSGNASKPTAPLTTSTMTPGVKSPLGGIEPLLSKTESATKSSGTLDNLSSMSKSEPTPSLSNSLSGGLEALLNKKPSPVPPSPSLASAPSPATPPLASMAPKPIGSSEPAKSVNPSPSLSNGTNSQSAQSTAPPSSPTSSTPSTETASKSSVAGAAPGLPGAPPGYSGPPPSSKSFVKDLEKDLDDGEIIQ